MSKGEAAQKRIVEAANALIYEQGYNSTAISDIADKVGVTKGNLHYHFNTKEDLLEAVINLRLKAISQQLSQWETDFPTPKLRLIRFVQMILNEEQLLIQFGCPMGSLNMELGKSQKELQSKSRLMFDLYLDWLESQFKTISTRNAKFLSRHLISMAQGAALMAYTYQDSKWLRQECKLINDWIEELTSGV